MNYAIIAAGEGSRLHSEGIATPKPLVSINGEPLLQRLVHIFCRNGADSIAIAVSRRMPAVADFVRRQLMPDCGIDMHLVECDTPSSMHSFAALAPALPPGKFILTTVDTVFAETAFERYVNAFEADTVHDGMMAVTTLIDDEKPLYVAVDEHMDITAFDDRPTPASKYISGGIYGLQAPAAIDVLQACLAAGQSRMRNYQRALLHSGLRLKAYDMGTIFDVDHAPDIAKAEALARMTDYPRL